MIRYRLAAFIALIAAAGCNRTASLDIPEIATAQPVAIESAVEEQASFALSKVIASIRRGQAIVHFPAKGFRRKGIKGRLCNYRTKSDGVVEWDAGSAFLGNWRTSFGEIFYETLSNRNFNVAGDPRDLFGQQDAVAAAEYRIGAVITDIRGNACHAHHWWDGKPLRQYSGEMYVNVEWTVYSNRQRRQIFKTTTEGYYKLVKPKRTGLILMVHEAFARAAENLTADKMFINIAIRKETGVADQSDPGPALFFKAPKTRTKPIEDDIQTLLPAVVTVRVGASHGSGFSISRDGQVLTNAHVVGAAKQVTVVLSNGVEISGTVERLNKARDVALIKVPLRMPNALPIRAAPSQTLERAFAIGSPLDEALKSTVTSGIVSGIRKMKPDNQLLIQADVPISPGNSGGPLLDRYGNVIGISTLTFSRDKGQNLNGFIPIAEALKSLNLQIAPRAGKAGN